MGVIDTRTLLLTVLSMMVQLIKMLIYLTVELN